MLISEDEIKKTLSKRKWNYANNQIIKSFKFNKFSESISFVNSVAKASDLSNHHPEISIKYTEVIISIHSNDFRGVTTKCINLALKLESIYNSN